MEENKYLKYAKVIDEICNAYENETDNEFKDCEFQMAYDKAFRSLHYSKWDEFKEACYQNERFRKYYKISYGEKKFNERFVKVFESKKQTKIKSNDKEKEMNLEDTDEFDFDDSKWLDDDKEDNGETKIITFKEFAQSKNMSQEDLTLILQRYGYFTNEGKPLKKWTDLGLFDKEKHFYKNTKDGKELFDKIIDKRHRYENFQIKQLLIEKGFSEDEIIFDKTLIILNGIKYKCFTNSDLKEIDKTQFDNIEQLYLNLNLCRLSGQIKNNEVKEQEKTDKEDDNFTDTDEADFDDSNWNEDDNDNDETNDDDQIKICPSCKTQMGPKVFICPKCGLRCGSGTIRNKTDLEIDKKIDEFKKQFQEKIDKDYNGINLDWDWDINLLIDKITESIRKHSSSDLKQYLRDYTEKPMCKNIKTEYDKAMNICCCSDIILKILNGLKEVFKEDELALEHIDKCYRSIDQLQYEKTKLAEKLKPEEDEDELSFDDDKDSGNDDFNFDDDEEDDDEFDFDDDDEEDDDDFNFSESDEEDDIISNNLMQKVNGMKVALYKHFDSNSYNDIDAEQLIDKITDLLLQEQISVIENYLEDILVKGRPEKDLESLKEALKYRHIYIVVGTTCENIGNIINNYKINSLNRKIKNHYDKFFNENGNLIETTINKIKTKQNWQKAGNIVGNILLAPLKAYVKMGDFLDEYNSRPDVQERRRIESIEYYCKFCGQPFKRREDAAYHPCHVKIAYDKALAKLEGGTPPAHHYCQIYEGGQKSEYVCKYCGKRARTISELVFYGPCNVRHIQNIDKYGTHGGTAETAAISKHEPAL